MAAMLTAALLSLSAITTVTAAPTAAGLLAPREAQPFAPQPWDAGAVTQYPIHTSCNATQRHQLEVAMNETMELAAHAKAHVLRWGNESAIYRKYFGDRPRIEVVGAFDVISNVDKGDLLFRCDNPDGNCDIPTYGGHWRGENATSETVICELSFQTRRSLDTMCAMGYNVAEWKTSTFWAGDMLHRLYHLPAVGQHYIEHFADDYEEVIDMARSNKTLSTHDSDTLQYFALEAWAYDIAVPGVGCPGPQHEHEHEEGVTATATATAAAQTSELPENCHTHEGGVVHCS